MFKYESAEASNEEQEQSITGVENVPEDVPVTNIETMSPLNVPVIQPSLEELAQVDSLNSTNEVSGPSTSSNDSNSNTHSTTNRKCPIIRAILHYFTVVEWIQIVVLLVGILFVSTGFLPADEAKSSVLRIAPQLLFLASVIIFAQLTKEAEVFNVIAERLAIVGRGNYAVLFVVCCVFASIVTIFLNLDTTAVLLTPVMLALAPKARITPLPLAMTTIWLANTASILIPVSNLTNLLAIDRIGLSTIEFAARMWSAQVVSITVSMVLLWVFYWRRRMRVADRYELPKREPIRDRILFTIASLVSLAFIAVILAGIQIEYAAVSAAMLLIIAFLWRERRKLSIAMFPWQLLIFVTGLFLVVPTLSRNGLSKIMCFITSADNGIEGAYRAAASGAILSNLINNLPAYVAGEAVIPLDNHVQLLSLLIGTNIGPVITPWGSLATLLWFEWCRRYEVQVPIKKFIVTGCTLAVLGVSLSVGVLIFFNK
jgi:arsenical pump membrane protein